MPSLKQVTEQVLFRGGSTLELFGVLDSILREHGYTINQLIPGIGEQVDLAFSATPIFNFDAGNIFVMTLTANVTSSSITNPRKGLPITLLLKQDATGGRTWVPPANLKLAGGALTLSAGANAVDSVTAIYDGTNWYEIARSLNM